MADWVRYKAEKSSNKKEKLISSLSYFTSKAVLPYYVLATYSPSWHQGPEGLGAQYFYVNASLKVRLLDILTSLRL